MRPHMQSHIGVLYERLPAVRAHVGPLAGVRAQVRVARRVVAEPTRNRKMYFELFDFEI